LRFTSKVGLVAIFFDAKHAPLVYLQAALFRPAAELDVMLLRSGKVPERCAERLGGYHAEIDLTAGVEPARHFSVTPSESFGQALVLLEVVHHGRRVDGIDQQVDIPHGVATSAVTSCGRNLPHGR